MPTPQKNIHTHNYVRRREYVYLQRLPCSSHQPRTISRAPQMLGEIRILNYCAD